MYVYFQTHQTLLDASFQQKFYFWRCVSKKWNAVCYGRYKKTKAWNNKYIFIAIFEPSRWLIAFKHMICIKTLLEKCRYFKNTRSKCLLQAVIAFCGLFSSTYSSITHTLYKKYKMSISRGFSFFFFVLEKIVITPNLEVRHIYIIRLQLGFNCTPFVNLMALLNWTIIIIIIIPVIVGVAW